MKTEIITIDEEHIDDAAIRRAGDCIKKGGLVAFPTETVYGLGGDALNPASSRKIYEAKGRPGDNPLIVHICRMEDLQQIVQRIPERAGRLAKAFWPGPLTLILEKSERVPYETTGGLNTVAVRMPKHKTALDFIQAAGGYVAAPSANTSGKPSPTLAKHVIQDLDGRIEMILDGGPAGIGVESTIVDLTAELPMILRPGYITRSMLGEVLGRVELDQTILSGDSGIHPKAPGMKYKHYAPSGELTIIEGSEDKVVSHINREVRRMQAAGEKAGVIGTDATAARYCADSVKSAGGREDEDTIARRLYRLLREFDDERVTVIYSEAFEGTGVGQATMNRLLKAAGHRVEKV